MFLLNFFPHAKCCEVPDRKCFSSMLSWSDLHLPRSRLLSMILAKTSLSCRRRPPIFSGGVPNPSYACLDSGYHLSHAEVPLWLSALMGQSRRVRRSKKPEP